jgi:small-conductance mechanosensitive channel
MEILENFLGELTWEDILTTCLRITMVLVLAWIAMKILRVLVGRLERNLLHESVAGGEPPSESQKRIETITRLVRQGLLLALWITAGLIVLQELGVEVAPIMASAGIVGLAVGFGAQNLVRDVISGFFIILENQLRVGDVAVINDVGGLVERINFRTTVLRDLAGTVHVFPNGMIDKLANMTNEWSAYVFDLEVSYDADTDKVIEVIREVGRGMLAEPQYERMMLGEPEIFGVDAFGDAGIVIKGRLKTKPIRQWDVGREFLRRINLAFAAQGIEIPYKQYTVHLSADDKTLALGQLAALAKTERPPKDTKPAVESPQARTDNEHSEEEVREVERKTANKPPAS